MKTTELRKSIAAERQELEGRLTVLAEIERSLDRYNALTGGGALPRVKAAAKVTQSWKAGRLPTYEEAEARLTELGDLAVICSCGYPCRKGTGEKAHKRSAVHKEMMAANRKRKAAAADG